MKKYFIIVFLLSTSLAFAETITLKSGRVLEGEVLERTDDYVKIDFKGVGLTFYADEIDTISEGDLIQKTGVRAQKSDSNSADRIAFGQKLDAWLASWTVNPLRLKEGQFIKKALTEQDYSEETINKIIKNGSKVSDAYEVMLNLQETSIQDLENFEKEFPSSPLVNDAKFWALFFSLDLPLESENPGEKRLKTFHQLKDFLSSFPDWQLDNLACARMRLHDINHPVCSVPREYLEQYVEARTMFSMGFIDLNYINQAYDKFLFLKENLDFHNDEEGALANDVYSSLIASCQILKKEEEAGDIMKEGLNRFPDNPQIKALSEKLIKMRGLSED